MTQDTIIEEVRAIREQIAAQFDYDLTALGAYYQALQKEKHLSMVSRQTDQPGVGGEETEEVARDHRAA
jgi:hypothetical protein